MLKIRTIDVQMQRFKKKKIFLKSKIIPKCTSILNVLNLYNKKLIKIKLNILVIIEMIYLITNQYWK